MKFCRKFLPLFVAFGVILNLSSAYAIGISARGGFVLNANTCEEVYSYQGDTPMVPASMTKVMAAYVIYDAMAQGRISKDTMIPVGSALAAYSRDPGYSNVYLSAGASYSLDELLGRHFCGVCQCGSHGCGRLPVRQRSRLCGADEPVCLRLGH